jgi:hypothetical protein
MILKVNYNLGGRVDSAADGAEGPACPRSFAPEPAAQYTHALAAGVRVWGGDGTLACGAGGWSLLCKHWGGAGESDVAGECGASSVVLAAGGVWYARMGAARASAGQDLVDGIDHGPGSNQPVHHLRMAAIRRSVKRSPAVLLRDEARQQVKRESLCCLCQTSQDRGGLGWVRFTKACRHAIV